MNYLRLYVKLIRNIESRPLIEFKGEWHHAFPRAIYGENNQHLIKVSYKEHYVLHHLLWKGLEKRYGSKDIRTIKMFYAFWLMSGNREREVKLTSRQYEKMREQYIEYIKDVHTGVPKLEKSNIKRSEKVSNHFNQPEVKEDLRNRGIQQMSIPKNREHLSKIKSKKWKITFSSGETLIIENLTKWCKENNYHRSNLIRIANGDRISHKDIISVIRLSEPRKGLYKQKIKKKKIYKLMDANNQIYKFECIKDFAKTHKLIASNISHMIRGNYKSHRGWTYLGYEEIIISQPQEYEKISCTLSDPHGNQHILDSSYKEFAERHNLKPKPLSKLCRGLIPMYKGWKLVINTQ
jgi:hypothetical protein